MDPDWIVIDGSAGEGGGQILRSSLALSLVTGRPFRIEKIRAGRKKPGLLRQHLTAVEAATRVGGAMTEGAAIGSQELVFRPRTIASGDYRFAVGTAGSATLVLQTVLPALVTADGPSSLVLEGGTHNPFAPPFDFLERAFLPLLRRMGPQVEVSLVRPGFYPAGGGRLDVHVRPTAHLVRLELLERGEMIRKTARALVARLPSQVGHRELKRASELLDLSREQLRVEEIRNSQGPGNVLLVEVESEHVTEVFTGFGQRGVQSEAVAEAAARQAREYIASGVPVGEHLADQLLLPLALAGGGSFRTVAPTRHARTNLDVIRSFLDVEAKVTPEDDNVYRIEIGTG